jgi:hypothetical protein
MKLNHLIAILISLVILLAMGACGPVATATPVVTETQPAPTATSGGLPTEQPATEVATSSSAYTDLWSLIDNSLRQNTPASIAYNAPVTMGLNNTADITLLLNPSVSPADLSEVLSTQIAGTGNVVTSAKIAITPFMRAELYSDDPNAIVVQSLTEAEQIISNTDTTKWEWTITAKSVGEQSLTLVLNRLVQVGDQQSWREIETYKSTILVSVTFVQWIFTPQGEWTIGTAIAILSAMIAFLTYLYTRRKRMTRARRGWGK